MDPSTSTSSDRKRVLDPDTKEEVTSSKKPRFELNLNVKSKCLRFIAASFTSLYQRMLGTIDPGMRNIFAGVQVMNIVFTHYSLLRQSTQEITSNLQTKVNRGTPKVVIEGAEYTINSDTVKAILISTATKCGLAFGEGMDEITSGKDWFGICGPYLNFLTGFGLRMRELRLGHSEFPYSKQGGVSNSYSIQRFGLTRVHHILLEGIRFPPERRSSMAQSLGPMTALLCYLQSPANFENKFLEAVKRNLAHIPNIEGIMKTIKGKPYKNISTIITLLADISILCTTRNAMRCFPAPSAFALFITKEDDITWSDDIDENMKGRWRSNLPKGVPSNFSNLLNFSGLSAFYLHKKACDIQWTFCTKFTAEEASQIVFHCWFGTYKEDLGVLSQITNSQNWFKRDELKDKFTKPNTEGKNIQIKLIKLHHYSKMSSASQTGELAQGFKQIASIPCFSGSRVRQFSKEFFKYLNESSPNAVSALTVQGIESDLSQILKNLTEKLNKGERTQECGTTTWFAMDTNARSCVLTDSSQVVPDVNFVVRETGHYFL